MFGIMSPFKCDIHTHTYIYAFLCIFRIYIHTYMLSESICGHKPLELKTPNTYIPTYIHTYTESLWSKHNKGQAPRIEKTKELEVCMCMIHMHTYIYIYIYIYIYMLT